MTLPTSSEERGVIVGGSQDVSKKPASSSIYGSIQALDRQKILYCSLGNIKRSRSPKESSVQESLILFASLNLRRSRKLCQGGVDNGDNDETRLLNHVGTLSDD